MAIHRTRNVIVLLKMCTEHATDIQFNCDCDASAKYELSIYIWASHSIYFVWKIAKQQHEPIENKQMHFIFVLPNKKKINMDFHNSIGFLCYFFHICVASFYTNHIFNFIFGVDLDLSKVNNSIPHLTFHLSHTKEIEKKPSKMTPNRNGYSNFDSRNVD